MKKLSELYSVPLESFLDDGIEVTRHSKLMDTEMKSESTANSVCSPVESKKEMNLNKKAIIALIGIALAVIVIVGFFIFYITTNSFEGNDVELEQFEKEKVVISSENEFDFQ